MNKRGGYGSMADRVARTPSDGPAAAEPPRIKHCWVTDEHGRMPGLLLEWRRVQDGYQGRVVRPVLCDGAWLVVEEWLPAGLLDRA